MAGWALRSRLKEDGRRGKESCRVYGTWMMSQTATRKGGHLQQSGPLCTAALSSKSDAVAAALTLTLTLTLALAAVQDRGSTKSLACH